MDNTSYNKVFGIGFHRTGTTTLNHCFEVLGIQSWWFRHHKNPDFIKIIEGFQQGEYGTMQKIINSHRAFTDNPFFFPDFYKWLDQNYPSSLFILTERDSDRWMNSCEAYFINKRSTSPTYPLIYGPLANSCRDNWVTVYEAHNQAAKHYFGDQLLVVNWERGDGWKELCDFLHYPIPSIGFPHLNSSHQNV